MATTVPVPTRERLAAQVDLLTDSLMTSCAARNRLALEAERLSRENERLRRDLRRAGDDLDGMHACNETLWREKADALREVEALRRELVEERSR